MQPREMNDQMAPKRRKLTCGGEEKAVAVLYHLATVWLAMLARVLIHLLSTTPRRFGLGV